ncbi:MAG: zf-HC2 domain-containing protein [Methylophilus sp.]|nr:zf-HC2 domain-containing protein [Methylophilus sp.]MDP3609951.1 zf-HC2 domain-containing protein [Methylophilus sp.]
MLNCKQTSQLVSQSLDRRLTLQERFAMRLHLWLCKYCKRFSQQLLALRSGMQRMTKLIEEDTQLHMPSESKARIAKSLESEMK